MTRYALIDCNNFFVSCERVFRPDLTEKPVAVLSNNDGCIIARSNEVKALGISMGIPLFKVKQIVSQNHVTLFSANFELYGDISQRIVTVLRSYTPLIEVYSIDECFVDLSELDIPDARVWALELKERIWNEVGVPVSIGVATTKTLAKVASTYSKTHEDGVAVVETDEKRLTMLAGLPVEDIWGVGRRMTPKLRDKGVSTALQLVNASDTWLQKQFNITGVKMVEELRGVPRIGFGDKSDQRKSIMRSRSFGHTVRAYHELESAVATFTSQAASRLRAQDSICSGIAVFLDTGKHAEERRRYLYKAVTLTEASADTGQLITAALTALEQMYTDELAYRKAGVTLLGITDVKSWQLSLTQPGKGREAKIRLMNSVDQLNRRYGSGTVWNAAEDRARAKWQSKRELRSPRYTTSLTELPVLHP